MVIKFTKNCSGVTLLATKPSIAAGVDQLLMKSTAQQTRTRRYWALTIGVPRPGTGTIKVPLAEEQRGNENMVVVKPEASAGSLKRREAKKTSTEYTVLDDNHSCALVEMKPLKAYRHQMQVHMISKLCSILGDHTYSSRIQTVLGIPVLVDVHNVQPCTQVVKKEILHQMNLTAHLMSSVPLHLHCVAITLPKWQNGKDLIITAPLPKYFWKSLKLLDLDRPDVTPELFVSDVR
ncbi:mitochondrial mRNA pseudouridine synthase Rpusd3-like [Glandiceps talaboti]